MSRKTSEQLTPVEFEIIQALWETGAANVQMVKKALKRDLAYTTVQTMLNVLHRKGKVKRVLEGRTYFYKPLINHKQVIRQTINDVVNRLFGGSVDGLMMSLVETKHITPQQLSKMKDLLDSYKE